MTGLEVIEKQKMAETIPLHLEGPIVRSLKAFLFLHQIRKNVTNILLNKRI